MSLSPSVRCRPRLGLPLWVVASLALIASCASGAPAERSSDAQTQAVATSAPTLADRGAFSDNWLAHREPIPPSAATVTPIPDSEPMRPPIDGLVDPQRVIERVAVQRYGWEPHADSRFTEHFPLRGESPDTLAGLSPARRCEALPALTPRAPYFSSWRWDNEQADGSGVRFVQLYVSSMVDAAQAQRYMDAFAAWDEECSDKTMIFDSRSVTHEYFPAAFEADQVWIEHSPGDEPSVGDTLSNDPSLLRVTVRSGSLVAKAELFEVAQSDIAAELPLADQFIGELIAAMHAEIAAGHRLPVLDYAD